MRTQLMTRLTFLLSTLALLAVVPELSAQNKLYTFYGDSAGDWFGHSVASAGDVNADGYPDFIVGATQDNGTGSGSARVLSGADGTILYTFYGDSAGDQFGWPVAGAGDVNNDGYDDVIVGARFDDDNGTNSGSARVFSGADGSFLYTFYGDSADDRFGIVAGAGDVNADGYADLIVGAGGDDDNGTNSGSARVFSGSDGSILYTFYGDSAGDGFGGSVARAGDVNQDGYDDLIVGARNDMDTTGATTGSARVLSGVDGSNLYTFYGDSDGDLFGTSAGAGDVNKDGYDDIIVGAIWDDDNGPESGSARVFSGADGKVLYTFYGDSADDRFGAVAGVGDVDRDGYDDLIVGAQLDADSGSVTGSVRVLSGVDGSILYTFYGDSNADLFGISVAGAGDVNQDGYADIIVGAIWDDDNGMDSGSARVFSGKTLSLWSDTHGLSWQGAGTQNLTIDAGARYAGRQYWMFGSVTGTQPGTPYGGVTIPLNLDTWTLVELSYLNTPTFTNFAGQLDSSGRASASINLPPGLPAALGFTMYHAYVVHNTNLVPFMASNAVTLHLR